VTGVVGNLHAHHGRANLPDYISAKYYQDWSKLDEVIAKTEW